MQIIKRNGAVVDFDVEKIITAITKANNEVAPSARISKNLINAIANDLMDECAENYVGPIGIETIQDMVESYLIKYGAAVVAKTYIQYRYRRALIRKANTTDESIRDLINGDSEYWNYENSNKNAKLVTTQRDYMAGITSTDIARRFIFPKEAIEAHDKGAIHIHDMDYAAENTRTNCELCNLNDMLQNGTVINGVKIEKPHRFLTAMTIATQIITAVSSSTYGGITVTMAHLAPFVRASHDKFLKKYLDFGLEREKAEKLADIDTKKEVADGVQTFNYQVNSMSSTNGQSPFLTVNLDINETEEYKDELAMIIVEFFKQRIKGMKNEQGAYVTIAFPKLIYALDENNIHKDSEYFWLTEWAMKCTAKRMVPDYTSAKVMRQNKINKFGNGDVYPPMGCRSFLTPYHTTGNVSNALDYVEGQPKYYGRFNAGVVSLDLFYIALEAKTEENFWKVLDKYAELAHEVQKVRIQRLCNTVSDVAPICWQYGAMARLKSGETLDKLIHDHYATISLGYAGLYEAVKYLSGKSHTENQELGLKIMQALNDYCAKWKAAENIDYSVYGTPIESTTYKFASKIKKAFGPNVFKDLDKNGKDRDYITNSYHVFVEEEIDPFDKLSIEAKFQKLSPGGAITYIETSDLTKNLEAIYQVLLAGYEELIYFELNTKSDYCSKCGYDGEIEITDVDGKLGYKCPNCGNTDHTTMHVCRRVCGYLSTNMPNQGRLDEIRNRYVHLDNHECC